MNTTLRHQQYISISQSHQLLPVLSFFVVVPPSPDPLFYSSTLPPAPTCPQSASPPTKTFTVGSPRTTHPAAHPDTTADRGTTAVPTYKPTVSSYTGAAYAGVKPSWPPAANSTSGSGRGAAPIVATTGAVSSCVVVCCSRRFVFSFTY